ncbi:MAG: hypothetical protein MI746_15300 [Pseudomonadales bacterium]|nr:hypothetical protein [Pseudomonadales bacterium]
MFRFILTRASLLASVCMLVACGEESELAPFTSDGCSLFPDASVITSQDWCSCCFEHDIAYWKGGTGEEREAADAALRDCVAQRTGNSVLAEVMYEGVRFGGSPYFYNWYRWGYGWGYERQYQELTREESALADLMLEEFFEESPAGVCAI